MDTLKELFTNKGVLVALWAFLRACITAFFPAIPQPVMLSADVLAAAVIAVVAVSDARIRVNQANARKLSDPE